MRILITGGMGFIGRHLLQTLADSGDHEVIALDNFTEQIHLSDQEMLNAPRQTLIKAGVENVADYEGLLEDLDVWYTLRPKLELAKACIALVST